MGSALIGGLVFDSAGAAIAGGLLRGLAGAVREERSSISEDYKKTARDYGYGADGEKILRVEYVDTDPESEALRGTE
jgi:hypothetical protein